MYALLVALSDRSDAGAWIDRIIGYLDTPLPFSPLAEYLLLLAIFWLLARRRERGRNLEEQAQEVLDQLYEQGELSQTAYEKYRQDTSLRPKD